MSQKEIYAHITVHLPSLDQSQTNPMPRVIVIGDQVATIGVSESNFATSEIRFGLPQIRRVLQIEASYPFIQRGGSVALEGHGLVELKKSQEGLTYLASLETGLYIVTMPAPDSRRVVFEVCIP